MIKVTPRRVLVVGCVLWVCLVLYEQRSLNVAMDGMSRSVHKFDKSVQQLQVKLGVAPPPDKRLDFIPTEHSAEAMAYKELDRQLHDLEEQRLEVGHGKKGSWERKRADLLDKEIDVLYDAMDALHAELRAKHEASELGKHLPLLDLPSEYELANSPLKRARDWKRESKRLRGAKKADRKSKREKRAAEQSAADEAAYKKHMAENQAEKAAKAAAKLRKHELKELKMKHQLDLIRDLEKQGLLTPEAYQKKYDQITYEPPVPDWMM